MASPATTRLRWRPCFTTPTAAVRGWAVAAGRWGRGASGAAGRRGGGSSRHRVRRRLRAQPCHPPLPYLVGFKIRTTAKLAPAPCSQGREAAVRVWVRGCRRLGERVGLRRGRVPHQHHRPLSLLPVSAPAPAPPWAPALRCRPAVRLLVPLPRRPLRCPVTQPFPASLFSCCRERKIVNPCGTPDIPEDANGGGVNGLLGDLSDALAPSPSAA